MAHDPLPEIHLESASERAKKQCSSIQNDVEVLPLAGFSVECRKSTPSTGLRRGFLYSSAALPTHKVRPSKAQKCGETLMTASKTTQDGPSIPDLLKIPLTQAEQKGVLYKDMLKEVMQPDEAMLGRMMEDSTLMEGFDDPAVMNAVAEIAHNPEAFSKHAAKVSGFYRGMAEIMGPKLQQAAAKVTRASQDQTDWASVS